MTDSFDKHNDRDTVDTVIADLTPYQYAQNILETLADAMDPDSSTPDNNIIGFFVSRYSTTSNETPSAWDPVALIEGYYKIINFYEEDLRGYEKDLMLLEDLGVPANGKILLVIIEMIVDMYFDAHLRWRKAKKTPKYASMPFHQFPDYLIWFNTWSKALAEPESLLEDDEDDELNS